MACHAPTKPLHVAEAVRCYYARREWRRRVHADGGDAGSVRMNAASGGAGASGGAQDQVGTGAEPTGRKWGRRLVTLLAGVVTFLVFVIVVGALLHVFRLITVIGTVFESFFTLHVFILGLVAIALAQWARSFGTRHVATIIHVLAIAATIGAAIPIRGDCENGIGPGSAMARASCCCFVTSIT